MAAANPEVLAWLAGLSVEERDLLAEDARRRIRGDAPSEQRSAVLDALVSTLASLSRDQLEEMDARLAKKRHEMGVDDAFTDLRRLKAGKGPEYAENARILGAHLREKWGNDRACPMCEAKAWLIDPSPVAIERAHLPNAAIPAFLVMCRNCGFEVHVSAEAAGVYEVDQGAMERAKE